MSNEEGGGGGRVCLSLSFTSIYLLLFLPLLVRDVTSSFLAFFIQLFPYQPEVLLRLFQVYKAGNSRERRGDTQRIWDHSSTLSSKNKISWRVFLIQVIKLKSVSSLLVLGKNNDNNHIETVVVWDRNPSTWTANTRSLKPQRSLPSSSIWEFLLLIRDLKLPEFELKKEINTILLPKQVRDNITFVCLQLRDFHSKFYLRVYQLGCDMRLQRVSRLSQKDSLCSNDCFRDKLETKDCHFDSMFNCFFSLLVFCIHFIIAKIVCDLRETSLSSE